jgi:hypothetical protein
MVEEATISPGDLDLVTLTDSPEEAIELIRGGSQASRLVA